MVSSELHSTCSSISSTTSCCIFSNSSLTLLFGGFIGENFQQSTLVATLKATLEGFTDEPCNDESGFTFFDSMIFSTFYAILQARKCMYTC